ncbi:MAG: hypothetical protein LW832_04680, partial [Parachlamydia sp.]|nr:hypothetical protein [Parachlamydia sp.]
MLLTILSSLLFTLVYSQDKERTAENLRIMDSSNLVKDLYHLPPGIEIRDITSEILAHPQTLEEIKNNILEFHRRIILFEYPSDGIKVKGYISFTPLSSSEPLLVLFRSGNRDFGLINPGNVWSTYKNYTILSSTLRGGVSEGMDEFGGADVADMKNLLDYLPELEKKFGIQVAASPLYFLGPSRGGMEMFLTLARYPSIQQRVTKAVALSALLDLNQQIQNRPEDMKKMFI